MLIMVEIVRLALEKMIIKFVNVFSLFRYYLPLEKDRGLHLNKVVSPLPKDDDNDDGHRTNL